MDLEAIRALIWAKIQGGHLPRDGAAKAFGRPGDGKKCSACEEIVTAATLMMEVMQGTAVFFLHGDCYLLWMEERSPKS